MTPKWIIAIIEPSEIISEGIASYWTRTGYSVEIKKILYSRTFHTKTSNNTSHYCFYKSYKNSKFRRSLD